MARPDPLLGQARSAERVPLDPRSRRMFWIGVVLALLGLVALGAAAAIRWGGALGQSTFLLRNAHRTGVEETASGLQYEVLSPGQGKAHPTEADVALVTYKGALLDGTSFDQSAQPTPMPVAAVVPGFAEALKLMRKGARYRFWIPPDLAYGADPPPGAPIPPDAVLVFDVDLIDFLPEATVRQMQMQARQPSAKDGDTGGR